MQLRLLAGGRNLTASRRPGSAAMRIYKRTPLCALLAVTLQDLALRSQPVLGLGAALGSTLPGEFVGAAADFVFEVHGNHVGPGIVLYDLQLSCFRPVRFRLRGSCRHYLGGGNGRWGVGSNGVFLFAACWILRSGHNWILLAHT